MNRKTKTQEEARLAHNEYMRKWRKANAEREKKQRLRRMYEEAVADLESVKRIGENVCVFKTKDGSEYIIKGNTSVAPDCVDICDDILKSLYFCGACGYKIMKNDRRQTKYCPNCGKAVEWND